MVAPQPRAEQRLLKALRTASPRLIFWIGVFPVGWRSRPRLSQSGPGSDSALPRGHPANLGTKTGLLSLCFLICNGGDGAHLRNLVSGDGNRSHLPAFLKGLWGPGESKARWQEGSRRAQQD